MQKAVKQLKELIHLHGPAQVAVWLGYMDHRAVQQWISRERIPTVRLAKVQKLINDKGVKSERIVRRAKRP